MLVGADINGCRMDGLMGGLMGLDCLKVNSIGTKDKKIISIIFITRIKKMK